MLLEWSVECEPGDPTLVVPWSDPDNPSNHFVDLRENPYDLDHIPEAEQHPALLHALRALNAARSPLFTAKCEAWIIDSAELEHLRLNLDLTPEEASCGFASYIDLLWRERSIFVSFHRTEQLLHRFERLALPLLQPFGMLDCVIRPALVDLTVPQEGFAISLYVKAAGSDDSSAYQVWTEVLASAVALLRSKELALS